jgi:hypothetical protein
VDEDDDSRGLYDWGQEEDEGLYGTYLPISGDLLRDLIDLLLEQLARFEPPSRRAPGAYASYRVMAGTSQALARLLALRAKSEEHGGARVILTIVESFLDDPAAIEDLQAQPRPRGHRAEQRAELIAALLAPAQKRHRPLYPVR